MQHAFRASSPPNDATITRRGALCSLGGAIAAAAGVGAGGAHAATPASSSPALFPLAAIPGVRHYTTAGGAPFPIVGDTAWSLIVQLTREQVVQYLDDRRSRRFNTILVNLIEHRFADDAPNNVFGDGPFLDPGDYATINEAYFDHAEYCIARAAERNILVLLAPSYLGYEGGPEGWYQEMLSSGAAKLRRYGNYLAHRFGGYPNIIWIHGGDYNPPNREIVRALQAGVAEVLPSSLHTVHCGPGTSARRYWPDDAWISSNTVYTYGEPYPPSLAAYARGERFFYIEGTYENANGLGSVSDAQLRGQAYFAILAGAMGHVFGNSPIWYFDAPQFFTGPWETQLGSPGAASMTHLADLLDIVDWASLVPVTDRSFITQGAGGGRERAVGAIAANRSSGLVYMPSSRRLVVSLDAFAGPSVAVRRYDPSAGAWTDLTTRDASGMLTIPSPGSNSTGAGDWVLTFASVE